MENEASLTKHRRYDLSMSKRTRKASIPMFAVEVNTEEERLLVFAPVTSQEKGEGEKVSSCTNDKALVKETVFAPATPRPSLKELMRVTNKERDATQVTEEDLVRGTVSERNKEDNKLTLVVQQKHPIVTGMKQPGMVRRCAKALNQMIKVRYSPKQKNTVHLIAK